MGGGVISSMSAMWLIPQLSLSGFSEGFNYISQIKFYYKQFIENMRSYFLLCAKWYRYKDGDNSTVEMVTKGSHKHIVWIGKLQALNGTGPRTASRFPSQHQHVKEFI